MRFTGLLAALLAGILALGAGSGAAPPSEAYMLPGYKTYKATLDVGGDLVVTKHTDTTSKCSPGQEITYDMEAGVEMGKPRPVQVIVTPYGAHTGDAVSTHDGEARHISKVTGYRETNYCDRPPATLEKPECSRNVGQLHAMVVSAAPTSGKAMPLVLVLRRDGGGNIDGTDCDPPSLNTEVENAELSLLPVEQGGIVLPLGITDKTLAALGRGKALAREVAFGGTCDSVRLDAGPASRYILPGPRSCVVSGKIFMRLKRVS